MLPDSKAESSSAPANSTLPKSKSCEGGSGAMDVDPSDASTSNVDSTKSKEDATRQIAFSIRELAARTGIVEEDLLETLVTMGWMTHWQSGADQATTPGVKVAKRNHRKLMSFYEQQQLLDKYGTGNESLAAAATATATGLQDVGYHGHDSSGMGSSRPHPRQPSAAHVSTSSNSSHGLMHTSALSFAAMQANASLHQQQQQQHQPYSASLSAYQQLAQMVDPIALLEIPETEGDNEDGKGEDTTLDIVVSPLTPSGLKDVAVVTLEMVKDYQYRYNIRLEPYVDWNGIDWVAYRSTLDG